MAIKITYKLHPEQPGGNELTFIDFHRRYSFHDFLYSFPYADIVIQDDVPGTPRVTLQGPLLPLCYNFHLGLLDLLSKRLAVAYTFGVEKDDYFLKFYLADNDLVCESGGQRFRMELPPLMKALQVFFGRVLHDILLAYPSVEASPYWAQLRQALRPLPRPTPPARRRRR